MDIVYLLGDQPPLWADNELRYSIRSMVKHFDRIDRIFVVGRWPDFLREVTHIPFPDRHKFDPALNINEKILAACDHPEVGDHFLCCSDDYFLLKGFEAKRFPYFHCGPLQDAIANMTDANYYRAHLKNTRDALASRQLPTLNFNVHAPIVYHKQIFKSVMAEYPWNLKRSYVTKSLYANTLKIEGELAKDCNIKTPKTKDAIVRKLRDAPFFSVGDFGLNDEMKAMIQGLYPQGSKWEK